jgi:predicted S18 family serine protease
MPHELMEDSMNTCSLNKASSKRTSKKTIESTVRKEENFIGTLSNAINYFTTPQLKMKKTPKSKTRIMNYNSLVSPKNKEMKQSLSQMGKKCSKFMTKKLKGNTSYANKSWIENTHSSAEFRSPNRVFKTNLNKFNTDKVLKTENDALPEEQTFYLMGKNY